jgi:hypothetical protein
MEKSGIMHRRNVVIGLAATPLLAYGMAPTEPMPRSEPKPDPDVWVKWQSWPIHVNRPEEWMKGRCSLDSFIKRVQPWAERMTLGLSWHYVPANQYEEISKRCWHCFAPMRKLHYDWINVWHCEECRAELILPDERT